MLLYLQIFNLLISTCKQSKKQRENSILQHLKRNHCLHIRVWYWLDKCSSVSCSNCYKTVRLTHITVKVTWAVVSGWRAQSLTTKGRCLYDAFWEVNIIDILEKKKKKLKKPTTSPQNNWNLTFSKHQLMSNPCFRSV